ncbi:2-dehydro-3-deoxygalactonokinase [Amphibiibacter pelophylacis]|uniref:2-dehydro-3-deoxygalactonokinase n=1 Tax=Amphibiibacter pelophylacis TaxID=1799477 RepID=A0ACC6NZU7_9BURK
MNFPGLIGVDWGSTHSRALLIAPDGECLQQRTGGPGAKALAGQGAAAWAQALQTLLGDWLPGHAHLPVLLCGMVGSAAGWCHAPYVDVAADLVVTADTLAEVMSGLPRPPESSLPTMMAVVPGLRHPAPVAAPGALPDFSDILRGEETQILGALALCLQADCVILPGTHSKWAPVDGQGRIQGFSTWWTGELFELATQHSLLGQAMSGSGWDEAAFDQGVATALARPDWLHQLFGVRARGVLGEMAPERLHAFLSGLLLAYECSAALARHGLPPQARLVLVCGPALATPYQRVLKHLGREATLVDGSTAVARGLAQLAAAAGLTSAFNGRAS